MRRVLEHRVSAIVLAALIALVIPVTAGHQSSDHQSQVTAATNLSAVTSTTVAVKPAAATSDGRWKLGGDGSCYWDPDDSGPDQCSQNPGRWKIGGDGSCYWDANDSGPNQCEPATSAVPTEARALPGRAGLRPGA
jgi:hypothetical protein